MYDQTNDALLSITTIVITITRCVQHIHKTNVPLATPVQPSYSQRFAMSTFDSYEHT